jgi:hypothetical protein
VDHGLFRSTGCCATVHDFTPPQTPGRSDLKKVEGKIGKANDVFFFNGGDTNPNLYVTGTVTITAKAWFVPGELHPEIQAPKTGANPNGSARDINKIPQAGGAPNLLIYKLDGKGYFEMADGKPIMISEAKDVQKWLEDMRKGKVINGGIERTLTLTWDIRKDNGFTHAVDGLSSYSSPP